MKYNWTILSISFILAGCGFSGQELTAEKPVDQEVTSPAETQQKSEDPGLPVKEENQSTVKENSNEDSTPAANEFNKDNPVKEGQNPDEQTEPLTSPAEPKSNKPEPENQEPSIPTVANPASMTVMVNKSFKLPDGYRPVDLVRPNVSFVFGNQQLEKALLREEAARALATMFAQAKKEGITLLAASGFRSYETQSALFENEVKQFGYEKASIAVAYPGTSEHQTGLSMDVTAASVNYRLSEQFGEKPEGKWLTNNAYKFGFILRYPLGKESITGYQYEPWHFRYVGTEIATEIFKNKLTLEEYYEQKEGV